MPRIDNPWLPLKYLLAFMAAGVLLTGCRTKEESPALSQRAYIWQRDWTTPVSTAIESSKDKLDGFVVLGAEIEWKNGTPSLVKPRINWEALRNSGRPCGIALRVAPVGMAIAEDNGVIDFICRTGRELIATANAAKVTPVELQLDFDCAQKKLSAYTKWVRALRQAIAPTPLVITTLPSWLDEPEFPVLVREAGRYVLQVHSLRPAADTERTRLICDPALARDWVKRAEKLNVPFEIALPTYRYRAGYDAAGKLAGIESDSVHPTWPPGTRVIEFSSDAEAMATLVREWRAHRPPSCTGIIWYRLPVGNERNNWPILTLRAVMEGRTPRTSFSIRINGLVQQNTPLSLADISWHNDGETDDAPQREIILTWSSSSQGTAEALPGWKVRSEPGRVSFSPVDHTSMRLPPGAERAIGWLRLESAATIHVEISR